MKKFLILLAFLILLYLLIDWKILIIILIIIVMIIIALLVSSNNREIEKQQKKEKRIQEAKKLREYEIKVKMELEEKRRQIEEIYDAKYGTENAMICDLKGLFARTEAAQLEASMLDIGSEVTLKCDSNNSYDRHAVKVICNRKHIGFIPREYSQTVHENLKNKKKYFAMVLSKEYIWNSKFYKSEYEIELKLYLVKE
ncbi:MAG: HIRAN domain-containing protein [Prevotellaceae bacterium]|jgi:hypothetical protein|nr:HIRAN domain-containing protein [Prevotellaceae bacterium]